MIASPSIWAPVKFRSSIACTLDKVRPLAKQARDFLAAQGLTDEELMACELVLVEACNNAVLYVTENGRNLPIEVEITCEDTHVELRVCDHTHGLRLPDNFDLPQHESETGRGLFIIHSLMDSLDYFPGKGKNTFVMTKRRYPAVNGRREPTSAIEQLTRKLAESDQIISEMAEELSSCYETLSAIFRCGAELGKTNDIHQFSRALCNDLLEITGSSWYVLRIVPAEDPRLVLFVSSEAKISQDPLSVPLAGDTSVCENRAAAMRRDLFFDSKTPLNVDDPLSEISARSFGMVHPLVLADCLIGTLAVGKAPDKQPFTAAQVNIIHTFADFLAIQIVNARLQEEQLKNKLVSRELEIAKTIQLALLPKTLPRSNGFTLAGYCESARQVGGDFYDVVQIDEKSLLLVIADVMGKGIPAAMFAAILRSLLRAAPEYNEQPDALLARANRLLFDELSEVEMFITAHIAHIDFQKRKITSACAGHCPILLGVPELPRLKALSPDGIPLGIIRDATFAAQTEVIPPGSRLLLYTDGLTEAQNGSGAFFGEQNLVDWFHRVIHGNLTAEQMKLSLAHELRAFQGQAAIYDDQTFLILADEQ